MIPLRLAADSLPIPHSLVLRLCISRLEDALSPLGQDAFFVAEEDGIAEFDVEGFALRIQTKDVADLDQDVVLVAPGRSSVHRLIRSRSPHNTFLVTEQCDQLCVMCSQPPKAAHVDLFTIYEQALFLAPQGAMIGITGGEPMLHKEKLFSMLLGAKESRPDLRFHVLTNGQHFTDDDMPIIEALGADRVLWGIPLYAADPAVHDRIVAKEGAFVRLKESLALLGKTGARIELRTVVLKSNIEAFERLAAFISRHLAFVDFWAIMQLENIGFGRMNWSKEFFDSSRSFGQLAGAIDTAIGRGTPVRLYNFPLCTVPLHYRKLALASISDWKNKFLPVCDGCEAQHRCAGFFEWHPKTGGYERLEKQ